MASLRAAQSAGTLPPTDELLAALLAGMSDAAYTKDTAGRYTLANAAMLDRLGLSDADQLLGKTVFDIYPAALASTYHADDERVLLGGETIVDREEPAPGIAGHERWYQTTKLPLRAADGTILGLLGISRSMEERRRAEQSSRDSDRRLREVMRHARCCLWTAQVHDDGGGHYAWQLHAEPDDEAVLQFLGFHEPSDQPLAYRVHLSMSPADQAAKDAVARAALGEARDHYSQEFRCVDSRGQVRWLHEDVSLRQLEPGSWEAFGVWVDVTDRRQAEETLRGHEELLEETGRIAKVGGWEFDVATMAGSWTAEVARIHGLPPDTPIDPARGIAFYHPDSRPAIVEAVRAAVEEAKPYDLELQITTVDGDARWVRTIGRPVVEDGQVVRVRGSMQDITDRKLAELAAAESRERLRNVMREARCSVWTARVWRAASGNYAWVLDPQPESDGLLGHLDFGGPASEPLAHRMYLSMAPEDRVRRDVVGNAALRERRQHYSHEYCCHDRLGREVWIHEDVSLRPTGDEEWAAVGVWVDVTERRQGERASSSQALVLESIAQGVSFVDGEGVVRYANPAFEKLFGYEPGELIGQPAAVLLDLPSEAGQAQVRDMLAVVAGLNDWEGDLYNRRKGGSRFLGHAHMRPMPLLGQGWSVTVQEDVTEPTVMLHLLSAIGSAGSLRDLMERVTRLLHQDLDFEAVGVRLAEGDDFPYYETHGFAAEFVQLEAQLCQVDASGRLVRGPDGQAQLSCMCGQVIRGRFDPAMPFFTERGSFWANNTTRLLASTTAADRGSTTRNRCNGSGYESVGLFALRAGGETHGLLQLNDRRANRFSADLLRLVERLADTLAVAVAHRRDHDRLVESEARYRLLAEHSDDLVSVVGADGGRRYYSPSYERITGWSLDELLSAQTGSLAAPDDQPRIEAARQANLRGEPTDIEYRLRCKDGRWLRLDGRCRPVVGDDGRVEELILWSRDITDRRALEEHRAQMQLQLSQAQKLEAVGRMAAGVAHDFNNMLSVIQGHGEMVLDALAQSHPLREDVEAIMGAAQRSAALTRQLLMFSRQRRSEPAALDLNEQIEGMRRLLGRLIGDDVRLEADLAASLWTVYADATQLDQIIANLVVNARDAMAEGGQVTICTRNETVDDRFCQTHPGARVGDYVTFSVTDTGCGMDQDTLVHVFEPFFTTKADGRGTGLGLATVYGIVQQHQGVITIESEPGSGTTIRVWLPRHEAAATASPAPPPQAGQPLGQGTILVVEDQPELLSLVCAMLRRLGYRPLAATTPAAAIALAQSADQPIDAVLSDVVMPDLDGPRLVERLRQLRPSLPALFMSGYTARPSRLAELLPAGEPLLYKPFGQQVLGERLHQLLHP